MEIERMFLLMLHVLGVVGAAIGIAFSERALFGGPQVDQRLLRTGNQLVFGALSILWLSGLVIIWVDTGFDLALMAAKPKLLAKVSVALLLSINGYFLHRYFFDAMSNRPRVNLRRSANRAVVMAAVSGASWLYAGFLGLAKPLAPLLGLSGFAALYLALLVVSAAAVIGMARPRVLQLFQSHTLPLKNKPAPWPAALIGSAADRH